MRFSTRAPSTGEKRTSLPFCGDFRRTPRAKSLPWSAGPSRFCLLGLARWSLSQSSCMPCMWSSSFSSCFRKAVLPCPHVSIGVLLHSLSTSGSEKKVVMKTLSSPLGALCLAEKQESLHFTAAEPWQHLEKSCLKKTLVELVQLSAETVIAETQYKLMLILKRSTN